MAITKTRYMVRGLLVAMILLVASLYGLTRLRDRPAYDWDNAKAAEEAGDNQTAVIHLRKLLQKEPDNVEAHLLMSELLLAEAQKDDPRASYASERPAMEALIDAAELSPDNLEIQRKLMHAFVDHGGETEAIAIRTATIVARLDPNDATAHFVLARQAQKAGRYEEALELLDKVTQLEKTPSLKTLMLKAQTVFALNDTKRTNELIEEAVLLTGSLSDADLAGMSGPSQLQLVRLLSDGVVLAPTPEAGMQRLGIALDVYDRLLPLLQDQPAMVGQLGEWAAKAHVSALPYLASLPASDENTKRRAEIASRVTALCNAAIRAQSAGPRVYWALARAEFAVGNDDAGFRYLDQGITSAATRPNQNAEEVLQLHHLYCTELMRAGRFRLTEPHVKVLLASESKTYKGWANLVAGLVAMVDGRRSESLEYIGKARQIMGDTFVVNVTMAQNLLRLGMHEEALEYLDRLHPQLAELNEQEAAAASDGFLSSSSRVHLAQARALIEVGRWDEATVHLDAVEVDPELAPRARETRAMYLWSTGQRAEALRRLEVSRKDFPNDLNLLLVEVNFRLEMDDKEQADKLLKEFVEKNPESLDAQYQYVMYLLKEGRRDEVDALLQKMKVQFADKPVVLLLQSQIYLDENDWAKANAMAHEIEKLPGGKGIGLAVRAQIALRTENFDEAARLFAQMDADGRNGASLRFIKSYAEARTGDVSQAIDSLAGVLGVSSMRDQAKQLLRGALETLISTEGEAAAKLKIDKLIDRYPADPELWFQRWNLALRMRDFELANSALQRIISLTPDATTANDFLRMRTHLTEGRPDLALELVKKALPPTDLSKLKPEQLSLVVEGAKAAQMMGEYQTALDYARAALKVDNKFWDAYLSQAEALRGLGQHDQAIEVAKALVAAQPMMYLAHHQLFMEYLAAKRFEEALEAARAGQKRFQGAEDLAAYRQLLQRREILALCALDRQEELDALEPGNRKVTLAKASAWVELARPDKAIAELERALASDPQFTEGLNMAAKLCFQQDRYVEAAGHAIAALGQKRDQWELYPLQATAQFRLEQYESAFDVMRTLIREKPEMPEGYRVLASLLQDNQKTDEALAVLEDGRVRLPEDISLVRLQVEILARSNRIDEANKLIAQAIGETPDADTALIVARIFFQAGAHGEAVTWVEKARAAGAPAVACEILLGEIGMTVGMATGDRNQLAEAVTHFEQVIAANPNQVAAANNLALLLGTSFGQPERALAVLDNATKGQAREDLVQEIVDTYVRILRGMERLDEALQLLDKALERNPDQSLLLFQKGLILLHNGQADGAREALSRALQLGLPELDRVEAQRSLDSLQPSN